MIPASLSKPPPSAARAPHRVTLSIRQIGTCAREAFLGTPIGRSRKPPPSPRTAVIAIVREGIDCLTLRRSPKLDHFCSREMTQPQRTIRDHDRGSGSREARAGLWLSFCCRSGKQVEVWTLCKTALWAVLQAPCGRVLCVHRCAGVHTRRGGIGLAISPEDLAAMDRQYESCGIDGEAD